MYLGFQLQNTSFLTPVIHLTSLSRLACIFVCVCVCVSARARVRFVDLLIVGFFLWPSLFVTSGCFYLFVRVRESMNALTYYCERDSAPYIYIL